MKARTMRAFLGCYLLKSLAHFRFRYNIIISIYAYILPTYVNSYYLWASDSLHNSGSVTTRIFSE
jgi:hypothetical protein